MTEPKVGDKCWIWSVDPRACRAGEDRAARTARWHFRESTIEGQTRKSWIAFGGEKFDKATGQCRASSFGASLRIFLTPESVDNWCFVADFRTKIASAARDCRDAVTLRKVAGILGVDVTEGAR